MMLQVLADGLVVGSIVSLGAIGLTLTFSILRFSNFGHGEMLAWGAYLALSALGWFQTLVGGGPFGALSFGWSLLLGLGVAIIGTVGLALLVDALLFQRLRAQGAITLVIASFGAALALRNLLFFIYGGIPMYYSEALQMAVAILPRSFYGGLRITPDQMFVLGLTLVTVMAVHLFLQRSTLGRAMRATSLNPQLVRVCGVDPERVLRATWVLGGVLAAVAGVLAGLTVQLRPTLGQDLLLPLFAAAILGGIGSVWGAVIGGLIVGLAESAAVMWIGAEYRAAASFAVLIVILLVRPTGLFPEKT
ncbi:MAG: branched-chain amino acid ABC transporter permease [Limnohabitans sp.]|jgi:branched-chain amino acid transport system permease protein